MILFLMQIIFSTQTCLQNFTEIGSDCVNSSCLAGIKQYLEPSYDYFGVGQIPALFSLNATGGEQLNVSIYFNDSNTSFTSLNNNLSCIDVDLLSYDIMFENQLQSENIQIFNSYDGVNRIINFTIGQEDFSKYFIDSDFLNFTLKYIGYFGLQFKVNKTIVMEYRFIINMVMNTSILSANVTNIESYLTYINGVCQKNSTNCIKKAQGSLTFCEDSLCSKPKNELSLYYGQKFWILFTIIQGGYNYFFVDNLQIYYQSDGGFFKAAETNITQIKKGQVIVEQTIDFIEDNVIIYAEGTLSKGSRILLATVPTNQLTAQLTAVSNPMGCVKLNSTLTTCPTCQEQCQQFQIGSVDCSCWANLTKYLIYIILLL
ncbi:hypothetical protein pb186bvf_012091 [Paramecium bursaria]